MCYNLLLAEQPGKAHRATCPFVSCALQVVCTVKLDEAAVPCDLQFDPLSKTYLLLLCSNGAILLYGVGWEGNSLDLVRAGQQLMGQLRCTTCKSCQYVVPVHVQRAITCIQPWSSRAGTDSFPSIESAGGSCAAGVKPRKAASSTAQCSICAQCTWQLCSHQHKKR